MLDLRKAATVVLVDPDHAQAHRCQRALAGAYEFEAHVGLESAMKSVAARTPDLLVVSVDPDPTLVYDWCHRLQSDLRTIDLPVLLTHTNYRGVDADALVDCGLADLLARPICREEFKLRARILLDLSRLRMGRYDGAMLDRDTGIASRERFDQVLRVEWLRNRRALVPMSVLLARVSHPDDSPLARAQLVRLATLIEANLRRAGDVAARFDDNQLACVLPNTDLLGAETVARTLFELMDSFAIPQSAGPSGRLELCVGTGTVIPHEPLTEQDLVRTAQRALEEARTVGEGSRCSLEVDNRLFPDQDERAA